MKKELFSVCQLFLSSIGFYVVLLILLGNTTLRAQEKLQLNVDSIYFSDLENRIKIQEVLRLINSQGTSDLTPELGYAYHRLGLLYNRIKEYQKAVNATLEAVRIRQPLDSISTRSLNNSLFNISTYLRKMGRRPEGEQYLREILAHNSTDKYRYEALRSLAVLKAQKGDYFEAFGFLKTLIRTIDEETFESILISAHKESIQFYGELPNAEKHLNEILEHEQQLKNYGQDREEMVNVNVNLGIIYSKIGDDKRAIEYYLEALPIYTIYQDSIHLGEVHNNLGAIYSRLNQYQKASIHYEQALIHAEESTRAYVYDNQGFYLQTDDPKEKLLLYQKAINTTLGQEHKSIDIYALPDLSTLHESISRLDILSFLIDKAVAWVDLFNKENDQQYLVNAKKTLYLVDQLVSEIRLNSKSKKSKLLWIKHGVDSYVLAVKVCYLLDQVEEAFYFMEKNKSLLLLESLEQNGDKKPKILDILSLTTAIEKHVSEQSCLVEYSLNEKEGFGLFCSENGIQFFELSNVPDLIKRIGQLKNMVKRPFESREEFEKFDELSNAVFNELFPFGKALNLLTDRKLTIVPDYELHNLPFELLVTQKNETHFEKNYLISSTEVSYLHSCSVDQQIAKKGFNEEQKMIGFVPTVFQNDSLSDLRLSEIEMKKIASFFPSKLILRDQAIKALFIESLGKYNIVHINSHAGYTEDSTPWLSLYDQKIGLEELANSSNYSNLVILDACKSALGEQEFGEGIMSLARAFFYGGSSSVIASQWQVNEKSSGEIFNEFYKNLKRGRSKSEALHRAKLTYLETNQLGQLSPYYWASFTLTGDAGHVIIEKNYYWIKVIAGVLALLLLIFVGRRVKTK